MKILGVDVPLDSIQEVEIPGDGSIHFPGLRWLAAALTTKDFDGMELDIPASIPLDVYRRVDVTFSVSTERFHPLYMTDHVDRQHKVGSVEYYTIMKSFNYFNADGEFPWEWVTKNGTLPKRISKTLRQQCGVTLTPAQLGALGSKLRTFILRKSQMRCDLTQDFDWNAGAYGDEGSCFWGCRAVARDMIREEGGFALRFYNEDGQGIARSWWVPHPEQDAWVGFNPYGQSLPECDYTSRFAHARVLVALLGGNYTYRGVRLDNRGEISEDLYINGGRGVVVGAEKDLVGLNEVSLQIYEPRFRIYSEEAGELCSCCDDAYDTEYYGSVGQYLCDHCRREYYSECGRCDGLHHDDNLVEVGGDWWCASCAEYYSSYCDHCDTRFDSESSSYEVDGETWCTYCYRSRVPVCPRCDVDYPTDEVEFQTVPGWGRWEREAVCPDCQEALHNISQYEPC